MMRLMKLELKKNKLGGYIILSVCMILFSMLFITVSMVDSASDPMQKKDSFENVFKMTGLLISFIFIVFYSILVSNFIIKEYNTKTILIMFAYPIDKKILISAKLLLISIFIAVSILAGYFICCSYIIFIDHYFDLLAGSFSISLLANWMISSFVTTLICICMGLLTFSAGMIKKSVPFTIVSSIIFIFIRQAALASPYKYTENPIQALIVVCITTFALLYSFNRKITQLETV